MAALYLTSLEKGSGKTTICAGLGKHLLNDGKKVGFFKPIIANDKNPPSENVDSDTLFIKHISVYQSLKSNRVYKGERA